MKKKKKQVAKINFFYSALLISMGSDINKIWKIIFKKWEDDGDFFSCLGKKVHQKSWQFLRTGSEYKKLTIWGRKCVRSFSSFLNFFYVFIVLLDGSLKYFWGFIFLFYGIIDFMLKTRWILNQIYIFLLIDELLIIFLHENYVFIFHNVYYSFN